MPVQLAPCQRHAHDRARSRTGGRCAVRRAIQVLLIAGALLAIGTPALASIQPGGARQHYLVALTAEVTPTAPGGVCRVRDIRDFDRLTGLCA